MRAAGTIDDPVRHVDEMPTCKRCGQREASIWPATLCDPCFAEVEGARTVTPEQRAEIRRLLDKRFAGAQMEKARRKPKRKRDPEKEKRKRKARRKARRR